MPGGWDASEITTPLARFTWFRRRVSSWGPPGKLQNFQTDHFKPIVWLKYCRYGVKYSPINQSINQSLSYIIYKCVQLWQSPCNGFSLGIIYFCCMMISTFTGIQGDCSKYIFINKISKKKYLLKICTVKISKQTVFQNPLASFSRKTTTKNQKYKTKRGLYFVLNVNAKNIS